MPNIQDYTLKQQDRNYLASAGNGLTLYAPLLLLGIRAKKEESGTQSMAKIRGKDGSQLQCDVLNAGKSLKRLSQKGAENSGIALENAIGKQQTDSISMRSERSVLFAEMNSGNRSTGISPKRALVSVVRVYENEERGNVYDLSVDDQHEFIAAGCLVHNCVWAATELMLHDTTVSVGSVEL